MKKIISTISSSLIFFAAIFSISTVAKSAEFFTIGTGGPTGVYFQTGNAICKMLHKSAISAEHGRSKGTEKRIDVQLLQPEDQITILVKLKKENFNLVLLNRTGSTTHIMDQANGKENNLVI